MEIEISADSLGVSMKIHRIREGRDNFSYLIVCGSTGQAAVIDPGIGTAECIARLRIPRLSVVYVINSHMHSDHTSGNAEIRRRFGGTVLGSEADAAEIPGISKTVRDGESLSLGEVVLTFLVTPGHTPGSLCIIAGGEALFTGDTLFMGDCGRTDLPGGSDRDMYASMQRLNSLPDDLIVYPGHDYGRAASGTLGEQKRSNKCLKAKSLSEFSLL